MTTGSVSYDSFTADPGSGSYYGTKGSRTWSGGDSPRNPRVPASFHTILREYVDPRTGRTRVREYKVRQKGYTPKRVTRVDHSYSKNTTISKQFVCKANSGTPGVTRDRPDLWLAQSLAPGYQGHIALLVPDDQLKLINKLSEKLKGSDFNMSVFLGEGHQTLNLLADSAIRIRKSVTHLRRGDFSGSLRTLVEGTTRKPLLNTHQRVLAKDTQYVAKNASQIWLEIQYGWLPLLNDAEECAKSIAHALNVPFAQTYRTSVLREKEYPMSGGTVGPVSDRAEHQATHSHRRSLIAKISEKPSVLAQLGLLDPELVAWELVPFSFVADWFIPIGSYLEARAAASRLTGTFITSDKILSHDGSIFITNQVVGRQACKGGTGRMTFTRTISTSLSVPMPNLKPLEKVASWQHCANAVALATQMFVKPVVPYKEAPNPYRLGKDFGTVRVRPH